MKRIISTLLCAVLILTVNCVYSFATDSGLKAGIVSTKSTALNVRSAPSASSAVLTTLPRNSYVTVINEESGWCKVEYAKNKYGYCSCAYIKYAQSAVVYVNTSSSALNVRTGAGTSYPITAQISKGTAALDIGSNGNWSLILFDGVKIGYASSSYLKKTYYTQASTRKIINVPDFKQTDTRWSGTYIGTSGKTIGQIGCTTTCLAMTESCRTGTMIYPDAMAKKLSYSSSGSLYWPSGYVTTASVSYADIKNIIDSGKPVILGLRTASYGTHWVVVKGYDSNAYYINDPGSSSRTTLAQALEKYPYFYKMAYSTNN